MGEIDFKFIGWCKEGTHDKVWGFFSIGDNLTVHVFWARRGKALQFKKDYDGAHLYKLKKSKLGKGYQEISIDRFREIWPNLDDELQGQFTFSILANKIR